MNKSTKLTIGVIFLEETVETTNLSNLFLFNVNLYMGIINLFSMET